MPTSGEGTGIGEHLAGVGERRLARVAGEHARDLAHAVLAANRLDDGHGDIICGLGDDVVLVRDDGHLRHMGDDDDLVRAREIGDFAAEQKD